MNGNDQAQRADEVAEILLHRKVKEIVAAEAIEYADALGSVLN